MDAQQPRPEAVAVASRPGARQRDPTPKEPGDRAGRGPEAKPRGAPPAGNRAPAVKSRAPAATRAPAPSGRGDGLPARGAGRAPRTPAGDRVDLDDVEAVFGRRGTGFLHSIMDKPGLVRGGHRAGKRAAVEGLRCKGLLFAGMGFSGVSANLVKDACTRAIDQPFTIVKHYQFPRHVTREWHTLAVSYSGETEETLEVAKVAKERGVPITAFTTGGTMATLADRVVQQPPGFAPRAAFGFTWFSLLGFLEGSGLLKERVPIKECVEAIKAVDATCGPQVPETENEAKQLARVLWHKIPQIYATPSFYGVGQHFRGMLNENAKKISDVDLVPESNHNDLTAWSGDVEARRHFTVLELSHAGQNPELRKRLDYMRRRYTEWGVPWHAKVADAIESFQDHVIAQARMIQFLDYTSVYVAALRRVDPSDIREIKSLKGFLRTGRALL